jgi:SAM-dependent methyltransferase
VEGEGYLGDALQRFRLTMAMIPPLEPGARVLELGSNPYFITRLLRERGLAVTSANWFGDGSEAGRAGVQTVREGGVAHDYRFDHFNLEVDPFPYPDNTFDLVLFCEILEHLPFDPVHSLAEIHRVLRPGGAVLITTPNATRTENVVKMLRGENVYEVLSGHGPYGRHNREYTVDELRTLLRQEGFQVDFVYALDIHSAVAALPLLPGGRLRRDDRGENLFALARATGEPRWRYPEWLYSSRHALARVVRPDVRMGYNDDLQTRGLHGLEDHTAQPYRWTGPEEGVIVLGGSGTGGAGPGRVRIEGFAPPVAAGPSIKLWARAGGQTVSWQVPCQGQTFEVEAVLDLPSGIIELRVGSGPPWRPIDIGDGLDTRRLGVALTAVSIVGAIDGGDLG